MTEAPYVSEDVLPGLLARFPDLLAGDQFAGGATLGPYLTASRGCPTRRVAGAAGHLTASFSTRMRSQR